ncbi:hypothetical protein C8J57DRAFT_1564198 [Mycena rebaudengoi]|nr:hypothetical protein C8J57DRAFT_1564198 [Mycena rebaudengoi]
MYKKAIGQRRKKDDETYSPMMSEAKKAANHRKAVRDHYANAARKLKRRQWDPPKKSAGTPATAETVNVHSSMAELPVFLDHRAASISAYCDDIDHVPASEAGAAPSTVVALATSADAGPKVLTSAELVATQALLTLAHVTEMDNDPLGNSIFKNAMHASLTERRPVVSESPSMDIGAPQLLLNVHAEFGVYPKPGRLPYGTAPLSLRQEMHLERTGFVGALSRVQAAQIRVFSLNSGNWTLPTDEEIAEWRKLPIALSKRVEEPDYGQYLSPKCRQFILPWTLGVYRAIRRGTKVLK